MSSPQQSGHCLGRPGKMGGSLPFLSTSRGTDPPNLPSPITTWPLLVRDRGNQTKPFPGTNRLWNCEARPLRIFRIWEPNVSVRESWPRALLLSSWLCGYIPTIRQRTGNWDWPCSSKARSMERWPVYDKPWTCNLQMPKPGKAWEMPYAGKDAWPRPNPVIARPFVFNPVRPNSTTNWESACST